MGVARMSGRPSVFTSQDYISDHIWKAFTNLLPPTSLRKIKYNVRTRSQARGFQAGGWNRQVGSTSPIHGHRRRKCWSDAIFNNWYLTPLITGVTNLKPTCLGKYKGDGSPISVLRKPRNIVPNYRLI